MLKAVILADDLTGALDTGVQFARKGIPVKVFNHTQCSLMQVSEPVLVINLDTRHISAGEAYARTIEAAKLAKSTKAQMLYVKTDSGLRGNVGAALSAAIEGWGESMAFVPAYPENGRTVKNGLLYVKDMPVTKSAFGVDLHNPVLHDSIRDILHEQCNLPVVTVQHAQDMPPGNTVRGLEEAQHGKSGADIFNLPCENIGHGAIHLYEAVNEADMAAAAFTVRDNGFTLIAGCAGFAKYLPEILSLPECQTRLPHLPLPLLVISGSTSEVALRQLRRAQACGLSPVPFPDLLSEAPTLDTLNARIYEALANDCALLAAAFCEDDVRKVSGLAQKMGLSSGETGERIARNLGRAADRFLGSGFSGTLFVFGGDTLKAFLCEAGAFEIRPLGEISVGVVLAEIIACKYRGCIITKSGSFGDDDIILNIHAMLSKAIPKAKEGTET